MIVSESGAECGEHRDQRQRGQDGVEVGVGAVSVRAGHVAGGQRQVTQRVGHAGQVALVRGHARDVRLAAVVHV